MTIESKLNEDNNTEINKNYIISVFDAINILETGNTIKVRGTIVSVSNLYKVISKSQSICKNIDCNHIYSQSYTPPRSLPVKNLDNIS